MTEPEDAVELAVELTIAWLGNPHTRSDGTDVPAFLSTMHATVAALTQGPAEPAMAKPEAQVNTPAVSARKSLASNDLILSMIDGKPYRTLRRHLSGHGLTPDAYRARYSLKPDYPMVAPAYSEARRAMAKKIGLGRKPAAAAQPAPTKRGRKPGPKASPSE